jgi:hypothetical protein
MRFLFAPSLPLISDVSPTHIFFFLAIGILGKWFFGNELS